MKLRRHLFAALMFIASALMSSSLWAQDSCSSNFAVRVEFKKGFTRIHEYREVGNLFKSHPFKKASFSSSSLEISATVSKHLYNGPFYLATGIGLTNRDIDSSQIKLVTIPLQLGFEYGDQFRFGIQAGPRVKYLASYSGVIHADYNPANKFFWDASMLICFSKKVNSSTRIGVLVNTIVDLNYLYAVKHRRPYGLYRGSMCLIPILDYL